MEYRLPTEAEWEYACRAGTTTWFSFGDDESQLTEYAWGFFNTIYCSESYAHTVGQKRPNPWGLRDMHGAVDEWCQDWLGKYPTSDVSDPRGPYSGTDRVLRGGSWRFTFKSCRSASRSGSSSYGHDSYGFRVLRSSSK